MIRRIAGAPISWGVCEVPGWGPQMDADAVLAQMSAIGLSAVERGPEDFLPSDPAVARSLLQAHGLELVAGFVPVVLHDRGSWDAQHQLVEQHLRFLAACGAKMLVLAAATGTQGYESTLELDRSQWRAIAAALNQIESSAGEQGVAVSLHPHYGTAIESPDSIQAFLEFTTTALCLDTGHVMVGGGDPVVLAVDHAERVAHVHIKDVSTPMAQKVHDRTLSYHEAVGGGLYTRSGSGDVDIARIVSALDRAGYQGWYVLEQDRVLDTGSGHGTGAQDDAAEGLRYLRDLPGPDDSRADDPLRPIEVGRTDQGRSS